MQERRTAAMSERSKKAEQNYFKNIPGSNLAIGERYWFNKGYEQAEKDTKDTVERIIRYLKSTDSIKKNDLMEWIKDYQNELGDSSEGIFRATINSLSLY
jgi:hypothetical protein